MLVRSNGKLFVVLLSQKQISNSSDLFLVLRSFEIRILTPEDFDVLVLSGSRAERQGVSIRAWPVSPWRTQTRSRVLREVAMETRKSFEIPRLFSTSIRIVPVPAVPSNSPRGMLFLSHAMSNGPWTSRKPFIHAEIVVIHAYRTSFRI